jgi:PAS domain S-box-containing protein
MNSVQPFSAKFFWNLLNSLPEPMVIKDRNHRWIAVNDAFCQWVKRDRHDLLGQSDFDIFSPDAARHCWEADEQLLATGLAESSERSRPLFQHTATPVVVQRVLFEGEDGRPYVVNWLRPTPPATPHPESTVQPNHVSSRALIEAIPDLLIRMKADGTYLDLAFEGGYKPTAIAATTGKTIFDVMPSEICEQRMQCVQKALATGELQVHNQELLIDGELIYEEVRVIPNGADEVLTMVRDVTVQRRAELELQRLNEHLESEVEARTARLQQVVAQLETEIRDRKLAKAQLQEKEEFLRSIYDGMEHQVFVVEVTPEGTFHYGGWNRFSEEVMGISSAAAMGKTPFDVFNQQDAQAVWQRYHHCCQTGQSITYEENLDLDREHLWSITTLNPLKDGNGHVYRLIGTVLDISDRKQAEIALKQSETLLRQQTEELKNTLQELQQTQMRLIQSEKMSGLGQLVAGVAHEINNPVNFIYGNLTHANDYTQDLLYLISLYQTYYPNPVLALQKEIETLELDFLMEDLPKLLQSMRVGAERIQKIVASLRTFSRMDEAEMKSVNLPDCIDSTLMILQNRLKAKSDRAKIEVIKEFAHLPPIECYAGQLNQVFMNILSNAIDALEDRLEQDCFTPRITIRLLQPHPHQVQIAIADNGLGIPETTKARIFDPFFTTKPIGKGTGMGLSISYQIVTEKHRGCLSCHSTPGLGTEFVIEIPTRQELKLPGSAQE